ncbi:MucBP domain-containing protein [Lactiplantibacillus plajomi]|uniref:MucBP domain-containing protein n=1 Tax=Lactiplantibacillus plajomi TaxID=1457217 RepID=A0ABV6K126_9LACO|nr:MucBP domain-containing protein [Lactiplantibacillus plajomi]
MRLTQLQRIQQINHQYQKREYQRSWKTTVTLLAASVGLGATLLTLPAAAATDPSQSVATPSTETVGQTSGTTLTKATVLTSSATSTSQAESAASYGGSTSSTSTADSSASTETETTAASGALSGTTSGTETGTSTSTVTGTSAASAAPTSSTAAPASSATSGTSISTTTTVTVGSSEAGSNATSSTTSTATSGTASQADTPTTSEAVPDTTVVQFGDPGIQAEVMNSIKAISPVTVGMLRNFNGTINIGTMNVPLALSGNLEGMQYLQYLPSTSLIKFYVTLPHPDVDLTPLQPDRFSELSIWCKDLSAVNLAPLTKIDPVTLSWVQFAGTDQGGMADYQTNANGMTNAQLAELAPWLTAIDNTRTSSIFNLSLGNNSITDFSPLSGFTRSAYLGVLGQRVNANEQPVNMVIGQPAVFTALPIIGLQGESLTSHYYSTISGSPTGATTVTPTPLTALGDGRFEIPTAYPTVSGANWFSYGIPGYTMAVTAENVNQAFMSVSYPNGVSINYDVAIYQPANWLTAPELNVRYLDGTTGEAIQPATKLQGTKIGEAYDLTDQTAIDGYRLDPTRSSALTGTYTQDPQALTYTYEREPAGGITVKYETLFGKELAPSTTISGYVGDAYTAKPASVAGYTVNRTLTGSLPESGQLGLTAGTITYLYTPNTLSRTVEYVDTVTNTVLSTDTVTGLFDSASSYSPEQTINDYVSRGYQLTSSDVPTGSALLSDPAADLTYRVDFTHQTLSIDSDSTIIPKDVIIERTVTRTINYQDAEGQPIGTPVVQSVTFERTATRDLVTDDVTYDDWQPTSSAQLAAVTSPLYPNTLPSQVIVPEKLVTADSPDETLTITYKDSTPGSGDENDTPDSADTSEAPGSSAATGGSVGSETPGSSAAPENPVDSGAAAGDSSSAPSGSTPAAGSDSTSGESGSAAAGSQPLGGQSSASGATSGGTSPANSAVTGLQSAAVPVKPAQSSATPQSALPQTNEQAPVATSLIGIVLLALAAGFANLKQWLRRRF